MRLLRREQPQPRATGRATPRPARLAATAVLAIACAITSAAAAVIDLNGYRFDPASGEPAIAPELRSASIEGPALYLVQFAGPVEESWKAALTSLGAGLYGYVPEYAFIARMDQATSRAASALPFVRWVGLYHTAYRISPEIGRMDFRDPGRIQDLQRMLIVMVAGDLFSTADAARTLGAVLETYDDPAHPSFVIHLDPARIPALASLPGVLWVEEKPEAYALNNTTKWVVQSNVQPQVPIWDHGILGQGQILAEMDSGLDYNSCWFRDTGNAPPGPNHRKVIDYKTWGGGVEYDGCSTGHGTHVAGTAIGDQSFINPGNINYNGMAYQAKIVMQDVGADDPTSCNQGLLAVPGNLATPYLDAYNLGARVHTNSWGSSAHTYNSACVAVDDFMWLHQDFLICFANGNLGPGSGSVISPATAKNCVSVGATNQAPNQNTISGYSSRGPTLDGRFKPTLAAPGGPTSIISANNNSGNPPNPTCATAGLQGTSMATPAVAGCALLVRDYFARGFYPLGSAGGTPLNASAALVKAVLVNCSRDMGTADQPNNTEGWGRVLLNDALYFQGETRELRVEDVPVGLATGEQASYDYQVDSNAEPLEITLVWLDYAGHPGTNPELVNDLDLVVQSPGGTTYRGNHYSGGQSTTGGSADAVNVEECVRRNSPDLGVWHITVNASNVPQGGHQAYALVATGAFANWPSTNAVAEAAPARRLLLDPAQPNPSAGTTTLRFSMAAAGRARLAVFDASGRRVALLADGAMEAGSHQVVWNGRSEGGAAAPDGVYFYRLEADHAAVTRKLTLLR